jgi:hypothetical protein
MENKKETPEETCYRIIGGNMVNMPSNIVSICKAYHSERLKIEAPSDEEIELEYIKLAPHSNSYFVTFQSGAKYVRDLLTSKS